MDNISKQYIKNVKVFFPIVGKAEKKYLRNLKSNLEDYCEEKSVTSLEELYQGFGAPSEVVNTYYSSVDIDYILGQIKRTRIIRNSLVIFVVSVLVALSAYFSYLYSEYRLMQSQMIFLEETFIE